ncbi:MAG: hypothetical protein NT072_07335 [Deltaproteobacteria bacterium]|nr:hypothetical protein [Deltaproteobacteria bacterium]
MEVSSDGGGVVQIGDATATDNHLFTKTYTEPTEVTMTAVPDEGYEFEYYLINGSKNSDAIVPLKVDCVISVEARFKSTSDDTGSGDDGGGCFTRTIMR